MPNDKKPTIASDAFPLRLTKAIGDMSVEAAARKCGIGVTTLHSYLKNTIPGIEKCGELSDGLDVCYEWLARGIGPMRRPKQLGDLLKADLVDSAHVPVAVVMEAIEDFETTIREPGRDYTPEQIAKIVRLLCVLRYTDISDFSAADIMAIIDTGE